MHQARGVGVLDRRRHLQHDFPHAVRSELVGFQLLLQRVTFDVLEHDKGAAVFLTPHVVHAHDGRVLLQTGDVTRLLEQPLDRLVPGKPVSAPDLDGHVPLEFLVASAVDRAEATASQDADRLGIGRCVRAAQACQSLVRWGLPTAAFAFPSPPTRRSGWNAYCVPSAPRANAVFEKTPVEPSAHRPENAVRIRLASASRRIEIDRSTPGPPDAAAVPNGSCRTRPRGSPRSVDVARLPTPFGTAHRRDRSVAVPRLEALPDSRPVGRS